MKEDGQLFTFLVLAFLWFPVVLCHFVITWLLTLLICRRLASFIRLLRISRRGRLRRANCRRELQLGWHWLITIAVHLITVGVWCIRIVQPSFRGSNLLGRSYPWSLQGRSCPTPAVWLGRTIAFHCHKRVITRTPTQFQASLVWGSMVSVISSYYWLLF